MAANPYFRYETSSLNLKTGMRAPNFPVQSGLSLHTYATEKYSHTTTTRDYGTTSFTYVIKGVKRDDLEIIKSFWETTLDEGYYDFTVIDNKNRMLFEASWNNWRKVWYKRRGGVYDVYVDIESTVPWTLPVIAAYPMVANNLNDHTLQGNDLTLTDAVLASDTDPNVIRSNGYCLRMDGDSLVSQLTGATGTTSFSSKSGGSLSIFCQFRRANTISHRLRLAQITNEAETIDFTVWQSSSQFGGQINNEPVGVAQDVYHTIVSDTWYDCAITYDSHNSTPYVYITPSQITTFTNFLYGSTDITDHIGSYMEVPGAPNTGGYTKINLLKEDADGGLVEDGAYGYVQNVFFFDGHMTPMMFNMMRRLCFLWDNATTSEPK